MKFKFVEIEELLNEKTVDLLFISETKIAFKIVSPPSWYVGSLEMPVPSQGHYDFHSFPVVD
jgi:hypothetical protein